MKCLLVDDEPGIREGLAMLLRRRGFEVTTAGDCAAAAAALDAQNFDVVVTDWRLPDGTAVRFAASCPCPVLAVSGHPEEVEQIGAIREALAKPVRPQQLLDRIAACVQSDDAEATGPELARDVRRVVDDVLAQLPEGTAVTCHDDGTFVVLRAKVQDGVGGIRHLGGDLRLVGEGDRRELELRLCRDGSADPETLVVPIGGSWPADEEFALDCTGVDATEQTFSAWCESVAKRNAAGGRICLLNVPQELEPITAVWETTHDMPMRGHVGPRLSAELAELWS